MIEGAEKPAGGGKLEVLALRTRFGQPPGRVHAPAIGNERDLVPLTSQLKTHRRPFFLQWRSVRRVRVLPAYHHLHRLSGGPKSRHGL